MWDRSLVSNESKLWAFLDNNPHATSFPPHMDHIVKQQERKHRQDQPFTISSYNAYQVEREMEQDFVGKAERFDIRQQLSDYIEKGIEQYPIDYL